MKLILPNWVTDAPDALERARATDRFFLQLACIYASREGNIRILADLLGVNYQTLKSQISNCKTHRVPAETFDKIENLLGADFNPRNG
jgi:hypothetical protein